jgi:hypothetical protein
MWQSSKYIASVTQIMYAILYSIVFHLFCFRFPFPVHVFIYKVVQIWPGLFVCKQVTVCPGHIWTTLYNWQSYFIKSRQKMCNGRLKTMEDRLGRIRNIMFACHNYNCLVLVHFFLHVPCVKFWMVWGLGFTHSYFHMRSVSVYINITHCS